MTSKVSNRFPKGIKVACQRNVISGQFQYLGRWVNKDQFRAFVYNEKGEETLADNYHEYEKLISSGLWFAVKPEKPQKTSVSKERKPKDDTICPTS